MWHNVQMFVTCFSIVYTAIGLGGALIVAAVALRSEKGFRHAILDGLETLELPWPIVLTLFFCAITLGWPFILRMVQQKRAAEEEER